VRNRLAIKERQRLVKEERQARAKVELREVTAGVAETVALEEARGERFTPEKPRQPRRRKDGLDWLRDKGRITPEEFRAGETYGDDYRKVYGSGVKSCLNDSVGGFSDEPAIARIRAQMNLDRARGGGLNRVNALVEIVDLVCGQGRSIRELAGDDTAKAYRLEERLSVALALLVGWYRIM
jgi:hypothetical protein